MRRGVPWVELMLERRTSSTALNLGWRNRIATVVTLALVWALARRDLRAAAAATAVLGAIDADFYRLVLRRRGVTTAAAAVPLYTVHRLTSAAAVPIGIATHLLKRR
jgi:hypothetical protein